MAKAKTKKAKESFSMDDFEEENKELTPDVVAMRSQSYEFNGEKLNAFDKTRQVAAESMGVHCCSPSFYKLADQLTETGSYDGMFADAVSIVWLCAQGKHAAFKAVRKPSGAVEEALEWWSNNGGNVGSAIYGELMETFGNIIDDVFTVTAETDSSGKGGSGQSLGE